MQMNFMEEEQNLNKIYEMYLRFQADLEFVQMLANPSYLECLFLCLTQLHSLDLAHQNYFQDQKFLNYLKYLNYFKTPEYIKFINYLFTQRYPQCLKFLELIQIPSFQKELLDQNWVRIVGFQQEKHWQFLGNYEQINGELSGQQQQQQFEQTQTANSKSNSNE